MMSDMTAPSAHDVDPDDPVEILRILPARFHQQFLAEYDAAVAGARRPQQYRDLHRLLRLWRLRAVAWSDPGYAARLQDLEDAVRTDRREGHRSRRSSRTGTTELPPLSGSTRPGDLPGRIRGQRSGSAQRPAAGRLRRPGGTCRGPGPRATGRAADGAGRRPRLPAGRIRSRLGAAVLPRRRGGCDQAWLFRYS
ncbi:MAG: DUF6247 family protein [Streptosporangiaceae bacterium]